MERYNNYGLIARWLAILYSIMHWFQVANGQDAQDGGAAGGINFGTPLPTLTPQDLPPPCVYCNKCNLM